MKYHDNNKGNKHEETGRNGLENKTFMQHFMALPGHHEPTFNLCISDQTGHFFIRIYSLSFILLIFYFLKFSGLWIIAPYCTVLHRIAHVTHDLRSDL